MEVQMGLTRLYSTSGEKRLHWKNTNALQQSSKQLHQVLLLHSLQLNLLSLALMDSNTKRQMGHSNSGSAIQTRSRTLTVQCQLAIRKKGRSSTSMFRAASMSFVNTNRKRARSGIGLGCILLRVMVVLVLLVLPVLLVLLGLFNLSISRLPLRHSANALLLVLVKMREIV